MKKIDEVDTWCKEWAVQRRKALGIEEFKARGDFLRETQAKEERWARDWAKLRAKDTNPDKFMSLLDYIISQYAQEDKSNFPGYLSPMNPKERLGKIRSTLGQIKTERVGAGEHTLRMGENGHRFQDWPEVYKGTSLLVHRAQVLMESGLREVMHLHYVWWEIPAKEKCQEIGLEVTQYWVQVATVKSFIRGAVRGIDDAENRKNLSGQAIPHVL